MTGIPACAAGVPIFATLPANALEALGAAMVRRTFPRGSLVLGSGEPLEHLIVVAEGRLNLVQVAASGRQQIIRTLEPGDFIGELALFTPTTSEGDLVAADDTVVCMLPRAVIQSLLAEHRDMALRLVAFLAARLQAAERRIADMALRDVRQRLAAELLRLAGAAGGSLPPRGATVRVPVPWFEMATRLGTTPESLSRRLKELADLGLLQQPEPRVVVLSDPAGLTALAEGKD